MSEEKKENKLTINQETMDVLVTNIIPTSKYFEVRFDTLEQKFDYKFEHMQFQFDSFKEEVTTKFEQVENQIRDVKEDMDRRFKQVENQIRDVKEEMDSRFEQVDKRFEQVDKRFEQVDEKLKQLDESVHGLTLKIEKLITAQETSVRDYIIERDRFYDKKFNNLRMFNLATISIVAGIVLKLLGVITF